MKVISYIRQSNSNIISQELFPIEQKDRVIGKFKIEYDNECESKNEYTKRYSDYLEECLDDELVFEIRKEDPDTIFKNLKEIMEDWPDALVPIVAEAEITKTNWAEKKDYEIEDSTST